MTWLPFSPSQRIVPFLPARFQRFRPSMNLPEASDSSIGYENVALGDRATNISIVDFGGPSGRHYQVMRRAYFLKCYEKYRGLVLLNAPNLSRSQ